MSIRKEKNGFEENKQLATKDLVWHCFPRCGMILTGRCFSELYIQIHSRSLGAPGEVFVQSLLFFLSFVSVNSELAK